MAISLVQNSITGSFSNPVTITTPNPSTPGNCYLVWIANTSPTSVTDNASPSSNTYILAVHDTTSNISLYYAENINVPTSGPTTISANGVGGGLNFIAFLEFSGVAATGALDQATSANGTGTAASGGSMTPSANGELVFGMFQFPAVGTSFTPGPGFTVANSNFSNGLDDEYDVLVGGAGTPISASATLGSSVSWVAIGATFKPAAVTPTSNVIFDSMDF